MCQSCSSAFYCACCTSPTRKSKNLFKKPDLFIRKEKVQEQAPLH
ncbi:hypothetical protein DXT99_16370 [Pontibacter diazotrophicus]|uniref:Uncharacterized protein n=1 Tax=Pontibacter diazotrophicus TaxID=1400979 RepID=A0A3D8L9R4_9BACT|nr:hypothetical protein DXT99_16370 [Pontibacter diazotrophicus]